MRILALALRLALPLALLFPAMPAAAQSRADSDLVRSAVARGEIRPLSELLKGLQEQFPGQVLDIRLREDAEGRIARYEFQILTNEGRLMDVQMDARTPKGRALSRSGGSESGLRGRTRDRDDVGDDDDGDDDNDGDDNDNDDGGDDDGGDDDGGDDGGGDDDD